MSVFIGSTPNCKNEDLIVAKEILANKSFAKGSISTLTRHCRKMFPQRDVFLFNRGRDSLYFFLKQLKLSSTDEVITQPFSCISVVAPIYWTNSNLVYVDIDRDTFNMDLTDLKKKITANTRVIIAQHTFGNIVDMKKIREIVDRINNSREASRKIYIVEDCAHLFFNDYEKYHITEYSDACFFSFAQDKAISCTQGSLLLLKKLTVLNKARKEYNSMKEQKTSSALYNARYILLWDRIKRKYYDRIVPFISRITVGKILIVVYRFLGLIKRQASSSYLKFNKIMKMSDVQAKLLLTQLDSLEALNSHREKIVEVYNKNLKKEFLFSSKGNKALLRYPIIVKNPNELKKILANMQIIVGRWYTSPIFPIEKKYYKELGFVYDKYPNTRFCCRYILNLPTNIEVDEKTAVIIANTINKYGQPI
ncbi:MAG: DegT/DnrJ/EryC1/StrS family aminotransferase [Candidatus Dojkabacteria bacterium]|jgi:perosamine synthetase